MNSEHPLLNSVGLAFEIRLEPLRIEASRREAWTSYIKGTTPGQGTGDMLSRAQEYVSAKRKDLDAEDLAPGPLSDRDVSLLMANSDSDIEGENAVRTVLGTLLTQDAKPVSEYERGLCLGMTQM
ncbi:hypothetical protein QFC20_005433 [Naganishia adeliensis]|uniref:Uncharacterized protein n=1 Tax=Naganishia adeliensis TaxID=92952 RepID=A0ACC2VPC9_9TREE|nr:hypothetical protein QFC20_005433 [Naganishia adeliensis]